MNALNLFSLNFSKFNPLKDIVIERKHGFTSKMFFAIIFTSIMDNKHVHFVHVMHINVVLSSNFCLYPIIIGQWTFGSITIL